MKRFSQIFLYITIALLIIWQLPWCYSFFAAKPSKIPFSMYSSVLGDFLSMGNEDGKGVVRRDQSGNVYTQEQTDSILPFFYMRQLMADERFPDSINGVAITPREAYEFQLPLGSFGYQCLQDKTLSFVGKYVGTCGPEYAR